MSIEYLACHGNLSPPKWNLQDPRQFLFQQDERQHLDAKYHQRGDQGSYESNETDALRSLARAHITGGRGQRGTARSCRHGGTVNGTSYLRGRGVVLSRHGTDMGGEAYVQGN